MTSNTSPEPVEPGMFPKGGDHMYALLHVLVGMLGRRTVRIPDVD